MIIPKICINIFKEDDNRIIYISYLKITILKKILFVVILFFSTILFAQTLGSNVDKKTLALGEIGKFKVSIFNLQGKDVLSAPKNKLLPFHFEEIKDTIDKSYDVYERTIEFAVFEEGTFTIPELEFNVNGKILKTVPYDIQIVNTAQKGDQINDIMNNKEVKLNIKDYWELYKWYVLGFLILIAAIFLTYSLIKYGKKKNSSPIVTTNKALRELDALKKRKYIENGNYRSFYVELIDITRSFITKQYQIPADVLLTDDLIDLMKHSNSISQENEKIIEDVFSRGDNVKFAKIFPNQQIMENDFNNIRAFIKRSSKDLEFENLRQDV